jgi:hypothetical protein
VVKHSIHNPKIGALNPFAGTRKENMVMASSYSTVVEPLTSDHEAEGSNPASNWPQEKNVVDKGLKGNNRNGDEEKLEDIQRGQLW